MIAVFDNDVYMHDIIQNSSTRYQIIITINQSENRVYNNMLVKRYTQWLLVQLAKSHENNNRIPQSLL